MRYWPATNDPRSAAEDDATARLRRLVVQRSVIDREIDAEIDRLEGWGFSWPTITRALGVTRQAARQRHQRRHLTANTSPNAAGFAARFR